MKQNMNRKKKNKNRKKRRREINKWCKKTMKNYRIRKMTKKEKRKN